MIRSGRTGEDGKAIRDRWPFDNEVLIYSDVLRCPHGIECMVSSPMCLACDHFVSIDAKGLTCSFKSSGETKRRKA